MFQIRMFQQPEHQPFVFDGLRPAALLIHGFPGTPAENRPLAKILNGVGWTVKGLLLPGFGPEIDALAQKTHQDWIGAVQEAIDDLKREHTPILLVGFSIGGALALIGSASRNTDGLVLLAPYWRLDSFLWNLFPIIRLIIPEIKPFRLVKPNFQDQNVRAGFEKLVPDADLDDPAVQETIRNITIPTKIFNELRETGKIAAVMASHISQSTLIIQGNHDRIVTPKMTRRLVNHIPADVTYLEVNAEHDLLDPDKPAFKTIVNGIVNFANTIQSGD